MRGAKYRIVKDDDDLALAKTFGDAKKKAFEFGSGAMIYERVGIGKKREFWLLASNIRGRIISRVLGDLPLDNE